MGRNVMITLTMDEYQTVLCALDLAKAYYMGDTKALPNVATWRASERAMSSTGMQLLRENIVEQVS